MGREDEVKGMPARRAPLFSLTILPGAALLFLVQLIFARMVLPLLDFRLR